MLDIHLNQDDVDMIIKNNKQIFQEFHNPILIHSQSRGKMVLLRKLCPFRLVGYKDVISDYLSVKLEYASNPKLQIAFVHNTNNESDKISKLSKAHDYLASNGCKNYNTIIPVSTLSLTT